MTAAFAAERDAVESNLRLDRAAREHALDDLDQSRERSEPLFDANEWERLVQVGTHRLSHRAFMAALFINLYQREPICHLPFRLLTALIDIDKSFTMWRHRHAFLAHRMIGARAGTGGTAGRTYLEAAAHGHRVFGDLVELPTFFIRQSLVPALTPELVAQLDFRHGR